MANKVKLTLISSKTDKTSRAFNLKSSKTEWEGIMFFGPTPGKSFSFFRNDDEYMHTSPVQSIEYVDEHTLYLNTLNSRYQLYIGDKQEPL